MAWSLPPEIQSDRKILIGTDWWTDCDDVAAIAAACRLGNRGVWQIVGIVLNACMPDSAASLDGFLRSETEETIQLGIDLAATDFGGNPPYQKHLAEKTGSTYTNEDCADGVTLYRTILAGAEDGSLEILEIGYGQVLAALLTSPADGISPYTGRELLTKKVKTIWVMGGKWPSGSENNFNRAECAIAGAATLWNEGGCPVPTVFLGYEVGDTVMTRPDPDDTLLYGAFCDHNKRGMRSSWDPMLILAAAACPNGTEEELRAAGYSATRGQAQIDPATGENQFTESGDGTQVYLTKTKPDGYYESWIAAALRK